MRDRLLNWLARVVWRYPILIVAGAAALAVYCALYANALLQINADTNDLIGSNRPFMKEFVAMMEEFGDTEYIYVVVANSSEEKRPRSEQCVDTLTRRLSRIEDLPGVYKGVTPREQLRIATRAMSEDELAGLSVASGAFPHMMSGQAGLVIRQSTSLLDELLTRGARLEERQQQRLGAAAVFMLNAVATARQGSISQAEMALLLGEDQRTEYFKSSTGRLYFITIVPQKDFGTLSVIEEPLRQIRGAIAEIQRQFPNVEIGLTGKPVLQADEMSTTNDDMMLASLLAFVLCAILFVLELGGLRRPILIVLAFACGSAWTYGLATAAVGQLNLLSIVFMLVLIGVGMDYGVHVIWRYKEHRRMGEDVQTAVRAAIFTAVRGNMTGAMTSSAVFFMALLTSFQGLRELGFVAGCGLLLCLIAMSTVLPALIVLTERRRGIRDARRGLADVEEHEERGLVRLLLDRPGTVLILAIVFSMSLVFAPGTLNFEQNLLKLQAMGLQSVEWEHRIQEDSASNTWFGVSMVDTLEQVRNVAERARLMPNIGEVHSVLDIIQFPTPRREELRRQLHEPLPSATQPADATRPTPPNETQPEDAPWTVSELNAAIGKLDLVAVGAALQAPEEARRLRQTSADLKALASEMEHAGAAAATQPDARARIEHNIRHVGSSLRMILEGDQLTLHDALPDGLRQQFLSPQGRFAVLLHPKNDVWELEPMRLFITDMRAVDPEVTGVPITHFESLRDMQRAFVQMAALAVLVILALVALDFHRPKYVLLSMAPTAVGLLWTIELMGLLGISFNLANFFSVPILIGLSVDGSVHILHRYAEGGPARFHLGATRRAVILTALTTIIGFGCLMLAHHRGLRSLGMVMAIGSTACMLASIIVLPALLSWFEKHPPLHRKHM